MGKILLIFSTSSYCKSLSVGSVEIPSFTSSVGSWRSLFSGPDEELEVGVVAPDDAGEPVAFINKPWASVEEVEEISAPVQ